MFIQSITSICGNAAHNLFPPLPPPPLHYDENKWNVRQKRLYQVRELQSLHIFTNPKDFNDFSQIKKERDKKKRNTHKQNMKQKAF